MLHLPILSYKKNRKKLFLFLLSTLTFSSLLPLIACSYREPGEPLKKGAAVYSKRTQNGNKPYTQINLYGYIDYTFSNYYPTYQDVEEFDGYDVVVRNSSEKSEDPKFDHFKVRGIFELGKISPEQVEIRKTWGMFAAKKEWIYKDSPIYNSLSDEQKKNFYLVDALEQTNEPEYQRFISLIKNEEDLKLNLRLSDEDQKVYDEYLKVRDYKNLNDMVAIRKEYSPWSDSFNYESVKQKLDLNNSDYIFIKDLSQFIRNKGTPTEYFLDGGLEIKNYKIDDINKTILVDWGWSPTTPFVNGSVNLAIQTGLPERFHSFLIPVEKGKIFNFNVFDWKMKRLTKT
ncbi:hypothetical protein [Mycoplasmopsis agassizii]|uniref:Lipoprotein n=1 Tax=Mycoplasmopsis agassizii TaxID=33922 RepID=A0ABX4H4Q4_9BACT|nr:hypothetical protein [Mycoplasmopsis agassizii]PAF54869.1 hypothetical protein CJF60_03990 [Mycoplasmopsis agassizii]SMC20700.1 hypothetical protein SAMN02745179_01043 [Mycoplasmopsis agassizii]